MPTLNAALAALERHLGFPESRSRGIARRLQDVGYLPLGAPGFAPVLDIGGFAILLISVATDAGLRTTAETTRVYANLPPGGVDLSAVPADAKICRTALDRLEILIDHAVHGDKTCDLTSGTVIDFCLSWPEITFSHRDGSVARFQPVGTLPGHWQGEQHRKSLTISGIALTNAVQSIFERTPYATHAAH